VREYLFFSVCVCVSMDLFDVILRRKRVYLYINTI
jgi:hypothetical protein